MLTPLKSMLVENISTGDFNRKQKKLLDVLLHPSRASEVVIPIDVFAHGPEATRLASIAQSRDFQASWAVQLWSVVTEDWLTVKTYPLKGRLSGVSLRNTAYMDAKNWYAPPPTHEILEKWAGVNTSDQDEFERIFSTREKLAEFWYDTKDIDWMQVPGGNPWPIMTDVAEQAFRPESPEQVGMRLANPKRAEKIQTALANFALQWGEIAPPVLHATFFKPGTKQFTALAQFPSAQDAAAALLRLGDDAVVKCCNLEEPHDLLFHFSWAHDRAGFTHEALSQTLTNLLTQVASEPAQDEQVSAPAP